MDKVVVMTFGCNDKNPLCSGIARGAANHPVMVKANNFQCSNDDDGDDGDDGDGDDNDKFILRRHSSRSRRWFEQNDIIICSLTK